MTITILPVPNTGVVTDGPAWKWISLDALESDTVDLPQLIRAIRATVAGNVAVKTLDDVTYTMPFTAGETRTIMAKRIMATNTTATGLEGAI